MKIKRMPNREINLKLVPEIGSKIISARKECGLSQKELGKLLGISGIGISLYENNKRKVSATKLWQISQITNLTITHFI
jgi:transcriptional regulator with XRE-family HTH domain